MSRREAMSMQTCAARFGLEAALLSHVLAQDRLFSRPNHERRGSFAQECNSRRQRGKLGGRAALELAHETARAVDRLGFESGHFGVLERRGQSGHRRPFVGLRIVTTVSRGWTMASISWASFASASAFSSKYACRS